jgi:hypothetical protein
VIEKVAEAAPAGTVTVAGTVAAFVFELASEITAPVPLAGELSETVPVAVAPLATDVGATVRPVTEIAGGFTVNEAVLLAPL